MEKRPIMYLLTLKYRTRYNMDMKKILLFVFVLTLVAGCGVKSDLAHPNPNYPRDYPVY